MPKRMPNASRMTVRCDSSIGARCVRLLEFYLLGKRGGSRPPPSPPTATALPIIFVLLAATMFLPIRFVAEANPDWRLLSWGLALIVVTISVLFLYLIG